MHCVCVSMCVCVRTLWFSQKRAILSFKGFIRTAFVIKDDCVLCKVGNKICVWSEKNFKALKIWQRKHGSVLFVNERIRGSGRSSVPYRACSQAVSKIVWHIPLLCIQWRIPDDGQRNCPKHVEFYSKKNWEISASILFYYKNLSRCTITWTSNVSKAFKNNR